MTPAALDIAIGLIIFLSILIAYFRGIIKEVFTLASLILATFVSYKGGHLLVPGMNRWLDVPEEGVDEKAEKIWGILAPDLAAKVVAFGGVFLLVFMLMTLLGYLMSRWVQEAGLGIADRLLGACFGFLRGFLLVFLLFIPCIKMFGDDLPEWAKKSVSVPILQDTFAWADKRFGLDKMIENRGKELVIKLPKVDLDKLKEGENSAEKDLQEKLMQEEKEIQKAPEEQEQPAPEQQPAPYRDGTGAMPMPMPEPEPTPAPAPSPFPEAAPAP